MVEKLWSAKRYIIPIIVFSLLYNAPHFFEFKTVYVGPKNQNESITQNRNSTLGDLIEETNLPNWDTTTSSNTNPQIATPNGTFETSDNMNEKDMTISYHGMTS